MVLHILSQIPISLTGGETKPGLKRTQTSVDVTHKLDWILCVFMKEMAPTRQIPLGSGRPWGRHSFCQSSRQKSHLLLLHKCPGLQ